jgi:nicotinamide/nicotinate riboside kinase
MIIGIGGRSRSGKTTLAETLVWQERSQNKKAIALHQDDFVKRLHDIPLIHDHTDWETPESIDFELLRKVVSHLQDDFEVIVIEGILAFADEGLNAMYDYCFFTTISEETFWVRKSADTRWGEEPAWYVGHIWDSFLKYGQPPVDLPNLMEIDGEQTYQMEKIASFLCHFDKEET